MKPCYADGCDRAAFARGLCLKHYKKLKKYGTPNGVFLASPVAERFLTSFQVDRETGCWNWRKSIDGGGYGVIREENNGRLLRAHRLSYEIHVGQIPDGMFVCHHCDNRKCVNPAHLFIGTAEDNNLDMRNKGRGINPPSPKGRDLARVNFARHENHPSAKLTKAQVSEIRMRLANGEQGLKLAREYGVSRTAISSIKTGKLWSNKNEDQINCC